MHKYFLILLNTMVSITVLQASTVLSEDERQEKTQSLTVFMNHLKDFKGIHQPKQRNASIALRAIAEDDQNPYCELAVLNLWSSDDAGDKAVARLGIRAWAQDDQHPKHTKAVWALWESNDAGDKVVARTGLRAMAKDDQHPDHTKAVWVLWYSDDAGDKDVARLEIRTWAQDDQHPNQMDALSMLRSFDGVEEKSFADRRLRLIAENENHDQQILAIHYLSSSKNEQGIACRIGALQHLARHSVTLFSILKGNDQRDSAWDKRKYARKQLSLDQSDENKAIALKAKESMKRYKIRMG